MQFWEVSTSANVLQQDKNIIKEAREAFQGIGNLFKGKVKILNDECLKLQSCGKSLGD
jgi:hypothetical protein